MKTATSVDIAKALLQDPAQREALELMKRLDGLIAVAAWLTQQTECVHAEVKAIGDRLEWLERGVKAAPPGRQ
jgi:hypothetical protein